MFVVSQFEETQQRKRQKNDEDDKKEGTKEVKFKDEAGNDYKVELIDMPAYLDGDDPDSMHVLEGMLTFSEKVKDGYDLILYCHSVQGGRDTGSLEFLDIMHSLLDAGKHPDKFCLVLTMLNKLEATETSSESLNKKVKQIKQYLDNKEIKIREQAFFFDENKKRDGGGLKPVLDAIKDQKERVQFTVTGEEITAKTILNFEKNKKTIISQSVQLPPER